jgi:ribonuclease P/MRP protein subunit POP1
MREDNTPIVTKRSRTPSRKLRLRLDRAKLLGNLNKRAKTVRQRKKDAKANAKQDDPERHVLVSRIPRLKKNKLAEAPRATVKYKKRQVNKTWLPTHLWHTKRAHMTRPVEPLWRMAIPLRPTEKSYRPSHRAAGQRGCIAWDTSYMSTVACRGTESAIASMLVALGFVPQGLSPTLQKKWKSGTRFAEGWVYERDNKKQPIAPVKVVFGANAIRLNNMSESTSASVRGNDPKPNGTNEPELQNRPKMKLTHQILIRIHPSAFHQFWSELLKVAKMQKPQVLVEDLRFELGSIEIQGPGSTEALLGVLRPLQREIESGSSHSRVWNSLAGLNNPGLLPQNSLLSIDIVDPRLNHPPAQIKSPKNHDDSTLNETLVSWDPDKTPTPSRLFSHKASFILSNSLPSQKAINRRRAIAPPGQNPTPNDKDPQIPVIVLASRAASSAVSASMNSQGSWTVLLPWSCVDLVWRSLMYYPLSSGGTPRFGGLDQKQQLAFEQQIPWFPADLPGTEAGKAWERTESERKFDEWIRRPPKHRFAWDKLDLGLGRMGEIGRGWACDWEYLLESGKLQSQTKPIKSDDKASEKDDGPPLTQRQRKAAKAKAEADQEQVARRRNTSSPESEDDEGEISPPGLDSTFFQLSPAASMSLMVKPSRTALPSYPVLSAIRIILLDRGTPNRGARIYRLPTSEPKPAPQSTQSSTLPGTESQDQPQSWSSAAPPPAQRPAPTLSTNDSASSSNPSESDPETLRNLWLALLPPHSNTARLKQNRHFPKPRTNRFGLPTKESAIPRESLARVNVMPKNAPKEIIDKYGPNSAYGRGNGEIPKAIPQSKKADRGSGAKGKRGNGKDPETAQKAPVQRTEPDHHEQQLLLNDLLLPLTGFPPASSHHEHPPVPHTHDLIGFVTSGSSGYNLSEGRGTAIGSIWTQRVVDGWARSATATTNTENDITRFLCIVRNAGESVGRLARWEVCG